MPEFKTLRRRRRPNDYLVLPAGFESLSEPDRPSPVFPVPRDRLGLLVKEVALAGEMTVLLEDDEDGCRFLFRQRSRIFRFPDFVTVDCFHDGHEASQIAVWSRSRYGISDRGVNRARIGRWIAAIERRIAAEGQAASQAAS